MGLRHLFLITPGGSDTNIVQSGRWEPWPVQFILRFPHGVQMEHLQRESTASQENPSRGQSPPTGRKIFLFTKPKFASLKFLGMMLGVVSGATVFLILFINFSNPSNTVYKSHFQANIKEENKWCVSAVIGHMHGETTYLTVPELWV